MYCNKCGNQLPDDSRFCNKCGANLDFANKPLEYKNNYQDTFTSFSKQATKYDANENTNTEINHHILLKKELSKRTFKENKKAYLIIFIVFLGIAAFTVNLFKDSPIFPKNEKDNYATDDLIFPKKENDNYAVDEDALADENCKTQIGNSHIFVCRRALSSAGLDPDKYVREKWITGGRPLKGIGFCEGFTRNGLSDQYKVHYDRNCNAKELYIWNDRLIDFERIK